ncbi:MAG: hypothetical protein H7A35_06445 [Planctomycetales bacterium]|nr:hypothetical protein [bacterium]UNM09696.1 MAG: hypothetical protein H7A35_06445 [Planctomycetales bacterium]
MRNSSSRQLLLLILPICLLCCSAARTTDFLPEQGELFERALAEAGLSPEDVRISDADLGLWGGGKYRLSAHRFLYDNPWKTSAYTRSLTNGLLQNSGNLGSLVTSGFSRLDCGVRLGLVGDELATERARIEELGDDCLAVALAELNGPEADTASLQAETAGLPLAVKQAAALVLFTTPRILRYREEALTKPVMELGLDPQELYDRIFAFTINTFEEEDDTTGSEVVDDLDDVLLLESLMDGIDWNLLSAGATLAVITAQEAERILSAAEGSASWPVVQYRVQTPLGLVVISTGDQDDEHDFSGESLLLQIDTGGNDTYKSTVASTAAYSQPLSICIDLAGNDMYQASGRDDLPSTAAGVFGYGVLIDAAGDDNYACSYGGAGFGLFGCGLLADYSGDDSYDGWGNCQASGVMGLGLLVDGSGDDQYHAFKYSQAYAGTMGCGLLVDADGKDHYLADMESHFNGGLYGPDHHVHFCQGSAYGRRADFVNGHSWAGGFALLLDGGSEADEYTGDCYVQGNSYWYAIGMIVDKGGDDSYRAAQYSQASAPHFSIGILQDEAGDDRYIVTRRQSMGHGRDWSLAWFEDVAGNDWYQGARTTLGTSHVNAISVFWDRAGDDVYLGKGPCLGQSEPETGGSPRDWLLTLGLFIDGAGKDSYFELPGDPSYEGSDTYIGDVESLEGLTPLDYSGDGKSWQMSADAPGAPGYRGVGLDAE